MPHTRVNVLSSLLLDGEPIRVQPVEPGRGAHGALALDLHLVQHEQPVGGRELSRCSDHTRLASPGSVLRTEHLDAMTRGDHPGSGARIAGAYSTCQLKSW